MTPALRGPDAERGPPRPRQRRRHCEPQVGSHDGPGFLPRPVPVSPWADPRTPAYEGPLYPLVTGVGPVFNEKRGSNLVRQSRTVTPPVSKPGRQWERGGLSGPHRHESSWALDVQCLEPEEALKQGEVHRDLLQDF